MERREYETANLPSSVWSEGMPGNPSPVESGEPDSEESFPIPLHMGKQSNCSNRTDATSACP